MPTIGFVVGPGELAYLCVVGGLYKTLGVPRPAFVPRASLTLVEPSLAKHLDRFGWDIPDLARGADELARLLDEPADVGPEQELGALIDELKVRLDAVGESLRVSDRPMLGPLDRTRSKVIDELDKLRQKLSNSRRNRQGTGLRQIRRLCANLRPRGRIQERVLTILPYLVAHGPSLSATLIEATDPFARSHGVLEL